MFKDILTFLKLDYRVPSLMILYFVVQIISIPKTRSIGLLDHIKISCKKKEKKQHVKNGRTDILVTIIELPRILDCT